MLNQYFKNASTITKYEYGPVGLYINRFIKWLEERGNHRCSTRRHLRGADHFCRWAESAELAYGQLDTNALKVFGEHLKKRHLLKYANGRLNHNFIGAQHFVAFLQAIGDVIPPVSSELTPSEPELLIVFGHWMRKQRGAMDRTVNNYRRVIVDLLHSLGEDPAQYNAESLRGFVLSRTQHYGIGIAKQVVTAVRMFLRFLIAMGHCAPGLDHAIPTIADWRLSTLPKYLPAEAVEKIIASCDRTTLIGVRDQAVLLLLARLGLRAGDVAGLEITAIDW